MAFSGQLSFFAVCFLGLFLLSLVQVIHGTLGLFQMVILALSALGLLGTLFFWAWQVFYDANRDGVKNSDMRSNKKFLIGVKLTFFICFASACGVMMIPMYYWLNGDGGHVCGAVDLSSESSQLQANEKANIYFLKNTNTDGVAVRYEFGVGQMSLLQGESAQVMIKFINPLDQDVRYRLKAKVAPSDALSHFQYGMKETEIFIPAKGEKVIYVDLHLQPGLDRQHKDISIIHFLFAARQKSGWKKMLADWHHW